MSSTIREVTVLLARAHEGDAAAKDQLFRLIENELRAIAVPLILGERGNTSWEVTALVDDVFVRLAKKGPWENRKHFYRTAARAMRRILIDHARKRRVKYESAVLDELSGKNNSKLVDLDEALERLEVHDARMAAVVELRHFGGRTIDETAEILGVSPGTVKNDWAMAKAWLHRELTDEHEH